MGRLPWLLQAAVRHPLKPAMDPLFILDTPKSLRAARAAPMETVVEQGFGVLAVHDLGHTMGSHTPSPQRPKGLR